MRLLTAALVLATITQNASSATVTWIPNSNGDWNDATNWSSNPAIPTAIDDVIVDVGGNTRRTISHSIGTHTVSSIDMSEFLRVSGGTLTATGATVFQPGSRLGVTGGVFNFGSTVVVDGADLEAGIISAGTISLPITSYTNTDTSGVILRSSVAGSLLDLSNLTTLTGSTENFRDIDLRAASGGTINLSALTNINRPAAISDIEFESTGAGSLLDLSSFADYTSGALTHLRVIDGGSLNWANPTQLDGIEFAIGGTITTSQLTQISSGSLSVRDGSVPDLSNVSNLDGSDVAAGTFFETGTIALPALTSYENTSDRTVTLESANQGSVLDMSSLTQLTGSASNFANVNVEATNGGQVDISAVTSINRPADLTDLSIVVEGTGSAIDMSSYSDFTNGAITDLIVREGATLTWSNPTTIDRIDMTVGGTVATSQLTDVTNGAIRVENNSSAIPNFSSLTNADGSTLNAGTFFETGVLNAPGITSYSNTSTSSVSFAAESSGSEVDLSNLASLTGSVSNFANINVSAENGGTVDLSALTSITRGNELTDITFGTGGGNSEIDLSSYNDYLSGAITSINVGPDSSFVWSNPTSMDGTDLEVSGTIMTSQLVSFNNARLSSNEGSNLDLSSLSNADGSSLVAGFALASASFSAPSLVNYTHSGDTNRAFRAERTGSSLNLPALANVTGNDTFLISLTFEARNGGALNLNSGTSTFQDNVKLLSRDGGTITGGTIILGNDVELSGNSNVMATVRAVNGGMIVPGLNGDGTLTVQGSAIAADGGAIIVPADATFASTMPVSIEAGGFVFGDGTIDAELTISGFGGVDSIEETLEVAETITLETTAEVQVTDAYTQDRGTITEVFTLMESAMSVSGSFSTPAADGVNSHIGNGHFLESISQTTTDVDISVYAALPGDANGDMVVDGLDFILWNASKFTSDTDWISGDFNDDGLTDGLDFIIWNNNKFTSVGGSAVPEPVVGWLGVLLACQLVRRMCA